MEASIYRISSFHFKQHFFNILLFYFYLLEFW